MSGDGQRWYLLNASPDLRQQIEATPALHPRETPRSTPIAGVLLTGGEVDTVCGLLTLRERQPFRLVGVGAVHDLLNANPIFGVLSPDLVPRQRVASENSFELLDAKEVPTGLQATLFSVPGKVPLYKEGPGATLAEVDDGTVGVAIEDTAGNRLFYIPGCASMTSDLAERLRGASLVLFDGTLWQDDEMIRAGLGPKTGRRMGHMSIDGAEGVIAAFSDLGVTRKILVHLNNSNPVLLTDTNERAIAHAAGWEVGEDGMEIVLG